MATRPRTRATAAGAGAAAQRKARAARSLAEDHFALEADLQAIWWLRTGEGARELRLAHIDRGALRTDSDALRAFWFPPTPDVPFRVGLIQLTPADWTRIKAGALQLPAGWSLARAVRFNRR